MHIFVKLINWIQNKLSQCYNKYQIQTKPREPKFLILNFFGIYFICKKNSILEAQHQHQIIINVCTMSQLQTSLVTPMGFFTTNFLGINKKYNNKYIINIRTQEGRGRVTEAQREPLWANPQWMKGTQVQVKDRNGGENKHRNDRRHRHVEWVMGIIDERRKIVSGGCGRYPGGCCYTPGEEVGRGCDIDVLQLQTATDGGGRSRTK